MTVIVKIMEPGEMRSDSDPQASFRIISGAHDVAFSRDLRGQAFINLYLDRSPVYPGEATPGDHARTNLHQELHTKVFVMNEAGKTIASYDGTPSGVEITLDGAKHTIAQGLVTFDFLRQILRLQPDAPLFIRRERVDSFYGCTIPWNSNVPLGEVWETVGRGPHGLWITRDDVFVTKLPPGAVLDDPKPDAVPTVPLGPPPKGDDATFFGNLRRVFSENPDAQVMLYRRGDEIHFTLERKLEPALDAGMIRGLSPELAASIIRLAQVGRTWSHHGQNDTHAKSMNQDGHLILSALYGREDYPLNF